MTIEVVSFIIGGILIGTAIVGGGFEIKEIKMPRVGAGVRIVSLIVGSGFLLLAMGMWSLNNPQLLVDQVPVSNILPAAETAAGVSQPEAQTRSTKDVQAEQPVQEQPVWDQKPAAPAFTGFTGQYQVTWAVEGVMYSGAVSFDGAVGFIRVAFFNPLTQTEQLVDQDLTLQESDGVFWYVGANPRDAYTQQLLDDSQYTQDNFRITADGQGGWTIDAACAQSFCFPASIQ